MYNMDGKEMRYADVVGVPGADEADGGPPRAARYITRNSNPYRLPSMDTKSGGSVPGVTTETAS
jgi:hypothetical protein